MEGILEVLTGVPVDLKAAASLAPLVFVVVFGLKYALRGSITGHEARIALAVGVIGSFTVFAFGSVNYGMGITAVTTAITTGIVAGVGGQILHDKAWNALVGKETAPSK